MGKVINDFQTNIGQNVAETWNIIGQNWNNIYTNLPPELQIALSRSGRGTSYSKALFKKAEDSKERSHNETSSTSDEESFKEDEPGTQSDSGASLISIRPSSSQSSSSELNPCNVQAASAATLNNAQIPFKYMVRH